MYIVIFSNHRQKLFSSSIFALKLMERRGNLFILLHINRNECENLQRAISFITEGEQQMKQSSGHKKLSDHISRVICEHTWHQQLHGTQAFLRYLTYLLKRVSAAATQSILAFPRTQHRIPYTYANVYTLWAFCLLAKHQTHRSPPRQEQHRIEVKWTNIPTRTNKLN